MNFTEDQEGDVVKNWLKQNWLTIVLCVVFAIAISFGWRYYQQYKIDSNKAMEADFTAISLTKPADVEKFVQENDKSIYSTLTLLKAAQAEAKDGKLQVAYDYLVQASKSSSDSYIQNIIKLRQAKLLAFLDKKDQALSLLDSVNDQNFTIRKEITKGDVLLHFGEIDNAKDSYAKAVELDPNLKAFVDVKLR